MDDEFRIRVGHSRSDSPRRAGVRRPQSFVSSVMPKRGRRSSGTRRTTSRTARTFHRRVVVQASIKKMKLGGAGKLRTHLSYLEREATQRNGQPGRLFGSLLHEPDAEGFQSRCKDDRHHFRFVISPEDAERMTDLRAFTRELVGRMESDLGTRLDWVAVDHYDTAQPHVHLVVRGVRDDGKDLVIPRDYISRGMREQAQDLASIELGPVSEVERRAKLARTIDAERATELDAMIERGSEGGVFDLAQPVRSNQVWRKQLFARRFQTLARMGLAEHEGRGQWRITPDFRQTLTRMGEQRDIVKTLHRAMMEAGRKEAIGLDAIFDPADAKARAQKGIVQSYGQPDDTRKGGFIIIKTLDSLLVYAKVAEDVTFESLRRGQIVTLEAYDMSPRKSDHTIAKLAGVNAGIYSPMRHELEHGGSSEFVAAHVRWLEALRRKSVVTRTEQGEWRIPPNYLDRAAMYEANNAKGQPAPLRRDSILTLSQMETAHGATWLDSALMERQTDGLPEHSPVHQAAARRMRVLEELGVDRDAAGRPTKQGLRQPRALDMQDARKALSERLGKSHLPTLDFGTVEGTFTGTIDRPSGKFAIIERSREFSLVPWRPIMERRRGLSIVGRCSAGGISWDVSGRQRGLSR